MPITRMDENGNWVTVDRVTPMWSPLTSMKKERLAMIKQAIQDKNPALFKELTESGEMDEFVAMKEKAIMDEFDLATDEVLSKSLGSGLGYLEAVQSLNTGTMEAWKNTLANHLEF